MVNLSCDTSSLSSPACTISPAASVTLVPGQTTVVSASFTVPSTIGTAASYPISITAIDATIPSLSHSQTNSLPVQVNPDFNFNFGTTTSVTAKAGAPISPIPLTINASGGFNGTISWGVTGCPQLATCNVSPNPSAPGQATNLTITTTAPTVSNVRGSSTRYLALWLGLPFGALGMVLLRRQRTVGFIAMLMLLGLAACGGGGGGGGTGPPITHPGTPAGTYTIVVTGTAGTTTHPQNFTLTVQ